MRSGARFCPQCGTLMEGEAKTPPPPAAPGGGAQEPREAGATREWTPPTREFSAFVQSLEGGSGVRGAGAGREETAGETSPPPQPAPATPQPAPATPRQARTTSPDADQPGASPAGDRDDGDAGEDVDVEADASEPGEVRRRVARVREGTRARVERMREEAIVVLEETPDDSGLRFVAAAAALFLVFLILLILSTTVLG